MFRQREGKTFENIEVVSPKEAFKNLGQIDLLKIDCKGCEQDVFNDAFDEIRVKVKSIIMEVRDLTDPGTEEVLGKIQKGGFSMRKINTKYGMVYLSR